MTFTLNIELGNDAMRKPMDVAKALKQVAMRLRDEGFRQDSGRIRDENGNTVGSWEVNK